MLATQLRKKCSFDLLGEPLGYAMLPKRLSSKNRTSGSGGGGGEGKELRKHSESTNFLLQALGKASPNMHFLALAEIQHLW